MIKKIKKAIIVLMAMQIPFSVSAYFVGDRTIKLILLCIAFVSVLVALILLLGLPFAAIDEMNRRENQD